MRQFEKKIMAHAINISPAAHLKVAVWPRMVILFGLIVGVQAGSSCHGSVESVDFQSLEGRSVTAT